MSVDTDDEANTIARCQHDGCDDAADWHAGSALCEGHALEQERWDEERIACHKRYTALVEPIKRGWGETALALIDEGEAVEWWAEIDG